MKRNSFKIALYTLLFTLVACGGNTDKKPSKRPTKVVATTDFLVTIHTKFGDMKAVMFEETPLHKENFVKLAKKGFYDGTTFHRVIEEFMIQGGDPLSKDDIPENDGTGDPGYTQQAEITFKLKHKFGSIAAARKGGPSNPQKRSGGSQFYIVDNEAGVPFLDNEYTVFGQVIDGLDIIHKIAQEKKDARDRPLENIEMSVEVETLPITKLVKLYGKNYNKQ